MFLASTLLSTAIAATPVRPPTHAYQIPWWERPVPTTPPPEASTPPSVQPYSLGEFDPIEGVILTTWYTSTTTWDGITWPDLNDTYTTMIGELVDRDVPVYICDSPEGSTSARSVLSDAGVNPDDIEWLDCNLDTIWMRDFGPFFSIDEDTNMSLGDANYYGRPQDNNFPTQASDWWGEELYEVPLEMEGGNFYGNGEGLCVSTSIIYTWTSATQDFATDAFADTLGCDETIWLKPLQGEGTGHVDMYFTFVDPQNVIVGEYSDEDDAFNAGILDENAATLEEAGLTVHRVPMLPNDDANGDGWADFFTVINGFFANTSDGTKTFYMPTFYDTYPDEMAEALIAMQAAMPDTEIVEVPADGLILYAGAIHCVMKSIPVAEWPNPCNDPYDFNDDDPRCAEPEEEEEDDDEDEASPEDTPDGSTSGNSDDSSSDGDTKGGCSCATSRTTTALPLWLLTALLIWNRRRYGTMR